MGNVYFREDDKEIENLQSLISLMLEKKFSLEKDKIIADSTEKKFTLQKQIEELEKDIEKNKGRMRRRYEY